LTGNGLKDPDSAMAGVSVVPVEASVAAVGRVLGKSN
jgi:hypothetical protein